MIKRIAILGSGAIGSVVGGMLTKAGHDVTLVDQWPDHVEAMKKVGLRLSGTSRAPGAGPGAAPARAAVGRRAVRRGILAMKSYDTDWAAQLATQYLAQPTASSSTSRTASTTSAWRPWSAASARSDA